MAEGTRPPVAGHARQETPETMTASLRRERLSPGRLCPGTSVVVAWGAPGMGVGHGKDAARPTACRMPPPEGDDLP